MFLLESTDVLEIAILFLKCFLVLLFFGIILPQILDYLMNYFICKTKLHSNSILVYNVTSGKRILYNFIYLFKLTVR